MPTSVPQVLDAAGKVRRPFKSCVRVRVCLPGRGPDVGTGSGADQRRRDCLAAGALKCKPPNELEPHQTAAAPGAAGRLSRAAPSWTGSRPGAAARGRGGSGVPPPRPPGATAPSVSPPSSGPVRSRTQVCTELRRAHGHVHTHATPPGRAAPANQSLGTGEGPANSPPTGPAGRGGPAQHPAGAHGQGWGSRLSREAGLCLGCGWTWPPLLPRVGLLRQQHPSAWPFRRLLVRNWQKRDPQVATFVFVTRGSAQAWGSHTSTQHPAPLAPHPHTLHVCTRRPGGPLVRILHWVTGWRGTVAVPALLRARGQGRQPEGAPALAFGSGSVTHVVPCCGWW